MVTLHKEKAEFDVCGLSYKTDVKWEQIVKIAIKRYQNAKNCIQFTFKGHI